MRNGKIHSCAYQYEYNIDEQRDALWQEETVVTAKRQVLSGSLEGELYQRYKYESSKSQQGSYRKDKVHV